MAIESKSLAELINLDEPAWPLVKQWIAEATNHVEILPPPADEKRAEALVATQVTTRSPMGAIIYESGGILVDYGWLRILGSGNPRLPRSLPDWNLGKSFAELGERPSFCLIADDAVGGFFAIDSGGLGLEPRSVCYFAPDSLKWENTGKGYSDFIRWCFLGDLEAYYKTMRWEGWKDDVSGLEGDKVFSFYPPLFTAGPPAALRRRAVIPITESYGIQVGELKS